jgi:hypothetical protein
LTKFPESNQLRNAALIGAGCASGDDDDDDNEDDAIPRYCVKISSVTLLRSMAKAASIKADAERRIEVKDDDKNNEEDGDDGNGDADNDSTSKVHTDNAR